jgi:hypothetical protein
MAGKFQYQRRQVMSESDASNEAVAQQAATHPLLAPFTNEQAALFGIVVDVWSTHSRWPSVRYVEHEMDRLGYVLNEILGALPAIRDGHYGAIGRGYQIFWTDRDGIASTGTEYIGLTVAGLSRLPSPQDFLARRFIAMLSGMAEYFLEGPLDPFEAVEPTVVLADVAAHLHLNQGGGWLDRFTEMLGREPATWSGSTGEPGTWRYTRAMRYFRNVADVSDYLSRLSAFIDPPEMETRSVEIVGPGALAASLDFLDTAWRLKYGDRLLGLPTMTAIGSLAEDAGSIEVFDARLSALGQIYKALTVERVGGVPPHQVQWLGATLRRDLPVESHPRIDSSIATLEASVAVRNAGQHANAAPSTVEALRALGLSYPVADWTYAWQVIRSEVVASIDGLREELLANL